MTKRIIFIGIFVLIFFNSLPSYCQSVFDGLWTIVTEVNRDYDIDDDPYIHDFNVKELVSLDLTNKTFSIIGGGPSPFQQELQRRNGFQYSNNSMPFYIQQTDPISNINISNGKLSFTRTESKQNGIRIITKYNIILVNPKHGNRATGDWVKVIENNLSFSADRRYSGRLKAVKTTERP